MKQPKRPEGPSDRLRGPVRLQVKPLAVLGSDFQEVLLLDAEAGRKGRQTGSSEVWWTLEFNRPEGTWHMVKLFRGSISWADF